MSKEWNFHCKTCDREPEGFPGFNHGEDILRSMYKVRKHAYAIQEQDTKDIISGQIGYISVEVMGCSYTSVWQFLHEHEGHEMELLSEYGDIEPIESDGTMSHMKRLMEEIELSTIPYACFSVKLQAITFDAIQQALEKAYLTMRANPAYLFCSEDDKKLFVMKADPRDPKEAAKEIAQLVNQATGKLMYIVTLPELENGTLLFGFFTY